MHTPQILLLILYVLRLMGAWLCDGEQTKVSYSANLTRIVVTLGLLYWGGFFGN